METSSSSSSSSSEDSFNPDSQCLLHRSSSSSESEEEALLQLQRHARNERVFRPRPDHFANWSEEEFFVRFRLTKDTVVFLLQQIEEHLIPETNRNHAISPLNQLLLTLRLYATGSMLVCVGDFTGVDKSTASRIVKRVTNAITLLAPNYINMPRNDDEITSTALDFYNISRFPKVIGAIDCTHIKLQSPGGNNAEYFRNRKGYFSLNVQVVGDSNLRIRDVVARWPGATHDQTIFNNSRIKGRFERNEFNNILLGDSGYALTKYLITPLLHPATRGEHLFNESQIRTRNPIERLFGVWKRRFPILSLGIRLSVHTAQVVVVACAVLHNLAISRKEQQPDDEEDIPLPVEIADDYFNQQDVIDYRQEFITYFSNLN